MKTTKRRPKPSDVSPETPPRNDGGLDRTIAPQTDAEQVLDMPLAVLERHPANRHPKSRDVAALAESFHEHQQLEPILVRPLDIKGRGERYQILSGETRFLAACSLEWSTIKARVHRYNDADALRIVAIANAKRTDLDPMERAEMLAKLTRGIEHEGAGLTQEQAGQEVGLSRSAVANCMRLLKLPKDIAAFVRAGDLPETFVRALLPLFDGPAKTLAGDAIRHEIATWKGKPADEADVSRDELFEVVIADIYGKSRSMSPASKGDRINDWRLNQAIKSPKYDPYGYFFDASEETMAELGIFEIPGQYSDKPSQRCINTKLWDTLQKEAAKTLLAGLSAKNKKAAAKDVAKNPTVKLTPAQERERERTQAAQRQTRLNEWAHKLKRWWLARFCEHHPDKSESIRPAILMFAGFHHVHEIGKRRDDTWTTLSIPRPTDQWETAKFVANAIKANKVAEASAQLADLLLWPGPTAAWAESSDRIPTEIVDGLFRQFADTLGIAWNAMFSTRSGAWSDTAEREAFLAKLVTAYGSARKLAEALSIKADESLKQGEVIELLVGQKAIAFKGSLFSKNK